MAYVDVVRTKELSGQNCEMQAEAEQYKEEIIPEQEIISELETGSQNPLPAPCHYQHRPTNIFQVSNCKAIVSLHDPHQILAASTGLCRLLGCTKEKAKEKTLKLILGAYYDSSPLLKILSNISSGIEKKQMFIPSISIFGANGVEHTVKVVCTPDEIMYGDTSGCSLEFQPTLKDSLFLARNAQSFRGLSSTSEYRDRHNFLTGLQLHKSASQKKLIAQDCDDVDRS